MMMKHHTSIVRILYYPYLKSVDYLRNSSAQNSIAKRLNIYPCMTSFSIVFLLLFFFFSCGRVASWPTVNLEDLKLVRKSIQNS